MLKLFFGRIAVLVSIYGQITQGLVLPFEPVPDAALEAEGITLKAPIPLIAALPNGGPASTFGWKITCDGAEAGFPVNNTLYGNTTTYYHSQYKPTLLPLPHNITIDMLSVMNVQGITYMPRQDGSKNGNIGQHKIYISTDNITFTLAAYGTWYDDQQLKSSAWETQLARYIKLVAVTEAGNRGPWTSASEFNVYTTTTPPNNMLGGGAWGPTIDFPLVPVAGAIQADTGRLLAWSSWSSQTQYNNPGAGQTLTSTFDPTAGTVTQRLVTNTKHDMFCPGIATDGSGHVVVTGGNKAQKTSIYIAGTNVWEPGMDMKISRGYHSSVTMGDGRIFTIGGSWNGGQGGKNGEIYNQVTNVTAKLAQCPVTPMYTADTAGVFRRDNHGWLFNWKNLTAFQAGPSHAMNWYSTNGTGGWAAAGIRGSDTDSMCGNAAMYDAVAGKILTTGGSTDYQGKSATANAHLITLGAPNTTASVQNLAPMSEARIFGSSVVLPDGTVFVTGGQTWSLPYSDGNSSFTSEIFNPNTLKFTQVIPNSTPRNYHSFALLMTDATVIVAGGGLCNTCSTNHFDAQIYTPQYLLNPDGTRRTSRPIINSISARQNKPGASITVVTNSAVTKFSLIRYGSATHTVNTDQRRIAIVPTTAGTNTYKITLGIADYGVVTPGYWMLFALNSAGVPSVATTIYIK